MASLPSSLHFNLVRCAATGASYTIFLAFAMLIGAYWQFTNRIDKLDFIKTSDVPVNDILGIQFEPYRKAAIEMAITYTVFAILSIATSLALFAGIAQENHLYTVPWLTEHGLSTVYFLYRYSYFGFCKNLLHSTECIIGIILFTILICFWMMVFSYQWLLWRATTIEEDIEMETQLYSISVCDDTNFPPPSYHAYIPPVVTSRTEFRKSSISFKL